MAFPAFADGMEEEAKQFCKTLAKHDPADANYVAGVDVHGKPVVPADLNDGGANIADPVIIPIQIDLAAYFGLGLPAGVNLEPTVSEMKIYQDGRIEYNGKNIAKPVRQACGEAKNIQQAIPKPDGQGQPDAVGSGDKIEGKYPE